MNYKCMKCHRPVFHRWVWYAWQLCGIHLIPRIKEWARTDRYHIDRYQQDLIEICEEAKKYYSVHPEEALEDL